MRAPGAGLLVCAAFLACSPRASADHPVTRLFTTEDGLVRNWVLRIRPDSRGRLWFCTMEGLSLFDGERFANYGTAQGLPNRLVTDILDAGDGSYWLATYGGLYRFRPTAVRPPSFEKVPLLGGSADPKVTILFRTRSGELWCGTTAGLYRVRVGQQPGGDLVPLAANPNHIPDISALEEDSAGALWVGMQAEWGLIRLRKDGSSSLLRFSQPGTPRAVQALLMDRDGFLWVGGSGGLCRLDPRYDSPPVKAYPPRLGAFGPVQSLYQDPGGDLWIGARGLARLRPRAKSPAKQLEFFEEASALAGSDVFAIAGDAAGNVWTALSNLGVMRILRSGFSSYTEADGLESKLVLSVFETHDGSVYAVSGYHHTLNRFDGERFTRIQPLAPANVYYFGWGEDRVTLQDRAGEWWMASAYGLLRYAKTAQPADLARTPPKHTYGTSDGLPTMAVLRLFEDRDGGIWTGCQVGVARWDPLTGRIQDFTNAVARVLGREPQPLSFAEDAQGQVWIGFYGGGLVRYRGGRFEDVRAGLPEGSINNLLADHAGRLWVASGQGGLGRIDAPADATPIFRRDQQPLGLRSNHLFALAEDRAGRIYVAGGQGIDWLDPGTGEIHHFAAGNGMPPGEVQRLHADSHGAVWFASHFGVSRYVPAPDPSAPPPAPAIHEIRVAGSPVLVSDEGERGVAGLAFDAGRDSVQIAYGAVDFSVGNRVRYRYRLLPVETEWRQPGAARSAQYAGIGSGAYRFEVQTVGLRGLTGAEIASVEFHIRWPFWQTWWFRLLAGCFVLALGLTAHLYRVRHLLSLERVRTRLAADLHDDLGSGLAEIAILTEVARTQAQSSHLEIVAERARDLRSSLSDIVWSVDPARDNLEDLIRRFRQTAAAMLGDDRLEFVVSAAPATGKVELTPDRRRNLLLFFKEIVTNIARHAHATRITIKVLQAPGRLELEVRDDGCGFRPSQAACGNGLRTMAQRAAALHGNLVIDSTPGGGCTVRLETSLD